MAPMARTGAYFRISFGRRNARTCAPATLRVKMPKAFDRAVF
jgi:hypothetical protein